MEIILHRISHWVDLTNISQLAYISCLQTEESEDHCVTWIARERLALDRCKLFTLSQFSWTSHLLTRKEIFYSWLNCLDSIYALTLSIIMKCVSFFYMLEYRFYHGIRAPGMSSFSLCCWLWVDGNFMIYQYFSCWSLSFCLFSCR